MSVFTHGTSPPKYAGYCETECYQGWADGSSPSEGSHKSCIWPRSYIAPGAKALVRPRSARAKFAWTRGPPFDVFIDVTRGLAAFVVVAFALVLPARARADVGVYPATKVVPVGGVIHGWGDGSGMAVYLVPASAGPQRYPCHGNGICEPTVEHAPGKPFVLLGGCDGRRTCTRASRSASSRRPASRRAPTACTCTAGPAAEA